MTLSKVNKKPNILFLGETYRADAITWIKGIEQVSGVTIDTREIKTVANRWIRMAQAIKFIVELVYTCWFGKKYDIVLAERSTSYGFFCLFTNATIKVVAQQGISDIYPNKWISKFYKRILQRMVYRRVDLVHAWGYAMTYAQLKSGASPLKIMVRPKGLDLSRYSFRNHFLGKSLPLQAIVTRSLENDYRHVDIIEAVKLLKDKNIYLSVWIIGGGSLLNELKAKCKACGVEDLIEFKGRIPNDKLPLLLSQCPIYISTPITEGVSSSLFESMASGCISIVTHLPGNKAFIHPGVNGELVPIASPEKLAESLVKVIHNYKQYQQGVFDNRKFIDEQVNREPNMAYFYQTYLNLLSKKL